MDQTKVIRFLIFWITTSIVLIFTSAIFPGNVVLGNDKLASPMAGVLSGLILTLVYYLAPRIVKRGGYKARGENQWTIIFFVANVIAIWAVKRLAIVTGLGISNILFVLIVAVFVTFSEWACDKALAASGKKSPISI